MSHNGAGTDATTAATATNTSQGGGGGSAAPAPSPPTPIVAVPTIAAAAAAANTADHDMDNDDGDSLPPPQFPMPGGPQRVVTFATEVSPSPGGGSSNSSSSSSRAGVSSSTAPGLAAGRRRKIAAAPGRSQLDWVRLKASGGARPNAGSGPQQLRRYTPAEVAAHGRRGDCWMALAGRVYDVTAYVEYHPGGAGQLLRGAGRDATRLFMQVHPWVNYEFLLGDACLVGFLLPDPAAAPAALSPFSAVAAAPPRRPPPPPAPAEDAADDDTDEYEDFVDAVSFALPPAPSPPSASAPDARSATLPGAINENESPAATASADPPQPPSN